MAISQVTAANNFSNNTGTCNGNTTTSAGDLVVVARDMYWGGAAYTIAANDATNGGAYTASTFAIASSGLNTYVNIFWKVYTTGLTPNVTFTGTGGLASQNVGVVLLTQWTGFLGTATALTSDGNSASGTSTALNSGSFNTSQNNELVVGYSNAGAGYTSYPPSGWTSAYNPAFNNDYVLSQIGVAQSIPTSLAGTLSSSVVWKAVIQGFYDAQNSTPGPFYYRRNVLYSI